MIYARGKEDGFILLKSLHMDGKYFDFFEYTGEAPVPEFIQDLPAFLSGSKDEAVTARPKKKKDESTYLKMADNTTA